MVSLCTDKMAAILPSLKALPTRFVINQLGAHCRFSPAIPGQRLKTPACPNRTLSSSSRLLEMQQLFDSILDETQKLLQNQATWFFISFFC